MVSAKDFKVGELVRFKDAEDQPEQGPYENFFGHLCVVMDFSDYGHLNEGNDRDCVRVKAIATGEIIVCYVTRLEKHDG